MMHRVSLCEVSLVLSLHTLSMEFLDFSEVVLTKQFLDHVCYGEPGDVDRGGHLSGMKREGKTEFPASWDEDRIFWALRAVLERPQYVNFVRPFIFISREISNVVVEITLRDGKKGLAAIAGYPLFGEGVMLNVLGKQHHIPHLDSRKGK
jgi:hypothetical protein